MNLNFLLSISEWQIQMSAHYHHSTLITTVVQMQNLTVWTQLGATGNIKNTFFQRVFMPTDKRYKWLVNMHKLSNKISIHFDIHHEIESSVDSVELIRCNFPSDANVYQDIHR